MGNGILDQPAGQGKFFLVRFFRPQHPVVVLFGFFDIETDTQLAEDGNRSLGKDKEDKYKNSISFGSHFPAQSKVLLTEIQIF
jgi:hypothetical protein